MSPPIEVIGHTRKPWAAPIAPIPGDSVLTIDVAGVPRMYLQTWRRKGLLRRRVPGSPRAAMESLAGDTAVRFSRGEPPAAEFSHHYTGVWHNDLVAPAVEALLVTNVKARIVLSMERVGPQRLCSLAIASNRPLGHIVGRFFAPLTSANGRDFRRVAAGRGLNARRLTRFSFPPLPGVPGVGSTPLPLPRLRVPAEGDIVFGNVLSPWNGSPVGPMAVPAADLTRGVLMAGTTGSGKTNTVMHVVPHAAKQGWVVVFDIKREYRSLHKTHDAKVYGFTGKNLLTHNIFKPAGPPELWIKQVASIVAEVINRLAPAVGSKDILIQGLDELYRKHGVYDGSTHYPHVGDFLEWLDEFVETRAHPRARGWSESLRRVLNSLAVGSTGRAFRVREGLSMARLMDGITVIELDGLGDPSAEALLASVLVQKIRNTLQDPLPEPALKGLIVVEEAQHLLAQGSEATSVLAATCREIRAYGVGMVYVSQTPSEFSKHALANANTIIVHKLNHPSDRSTAVRILGLDKEHAHLIERLRPGEAIMRSDALAHVRLPKVRRPVVRDDDLPATRVERSDVSSSFAQRGEAKRRYRRLSNRERDAFWAIANSEAIYPRAIREHLRISQKNAKAVLGSLIRGGLVGYCPARKNGHNKPRHIHFLTPLGQEVVRSQDGLAPDRRPKSDPRPHAEVVAEVVERLGVRRIPDRRFDILYEEEGERRAIEVETGSNNDAQILENHRKSVDLQGFSHFVASSARVGNRILQVVAAAAFRSRQSHEVQVADIAAPGSSSRFEFRPAGGG